MRLTLTTLLVCWVMCIENDVLSQSACLASQNDYAFTAPTSGRSIDRGDFNNDGKQDVIIGNYGIGGTNKLNLLLGNGNGTFQAPILGEIGTSVMDIKAFDFNNDGNMDIVATNAITIATISVVFGNGDGTFLPPVTYLLTASTPTGIVIKDFNNDGTADIVTIHNNGFDLFTGSTILPGTFAMASPFVVAGGPRGVTAADYNGDGFQDVITGNNSTANLSIRMGNGAGGFAAAVNYATGNGCAIVVSGDFNNDGDIDVASANETGDNITVLTNNGSGVFTTVNYATGDLPKGMIVTDINSDGIVDLLVLNNFENTISKFIGIGDGTFAAPVKTLTIGGPWDLVAGNFNADAYPDIAVSTTQASAMPVFLGNATGTLSSGSFTQTGTAPKSLHSADFNGDGDPDIVTANSGDNTFTLTLGQAGGTFSALTAFSTGTTPVSIFTGDVNNDGKADVVTANQGSNNLSVFIGNGAGGFSAPTSVACNTAPTFVTLADIDNDGNLDAIVINSSSNAFCVLNGTGSGSFGAPVSYAAGTNPVALVVRNFNADMFKDIAIVNKGSNNVSTFLNSGSGTFPTIVNTALPYSPVSIDAADLNNNGTIDLVVTSGSVQLSRLMNTAGAFTHTAISGNTSSLATGVVLNDFNNDGNQDILIISAESAGLTGNAGLFTGSGTGTFTFSKKFSLAVGPLAIISADFNLDGRKDAAVVNETSKVVTILLNTTAQITALSATTFCNGGSVVLQSFPTTNYSWSNGSTSQSITATTSGSYTVTTSEGTSGYCSSTSPAVAVSVTAGPSAPTITAGGPTTLCAGGNVVLTSSVATGNTWSNGATTQSITVSTSGNYTVTQTVAGCTSAASNTISVAIAAVPVITASGPTSFCSGGSVVLTSSQPTGNLWSNGATTPSITVTTGGSYTVTATVSGCPSSTSAPTVVTITPSPVPTISAGGPTTFCSGGNVVLTSSAATGNTWSNGATTASIIVAASGSYTVSAAAGSCPASTSAPMAVTVNPIPAAPTISAGGPTTFCVGGNVVLTSSATAGNTWSTGATTQSITVSATGNYTATVTSAGCVSPASAPVSVTVNAIPSAPTITAAGSTTFCAGGSVVLTSSSATGNLWSNGATTPSITVTTSGSYTVTATVSGCTSPASAATNVTVTPTPATPTISAGGPLSFCAGGNVVLTSSASTGNLWSNGATTQSITVTATGSYSVTSTVSGCPSAASAPVSVTVNPLPATPVITAAGSTTFCAGGNVVLTSSASTGNLWSNGATTQSITVTTAGTYNVTETSAGCTSAVSNTISITVNPVPAVPTITTSGATIFCDGDNVVLTSSSVTDNVWSNGATTQSITITASGNYSVEVVTSGCASGTSAATAVTVNAVPATPTITPSGSTTFCAGGNVVLTSSSATGNLWSNGATTQSITVTTSGNYSVTVTTAGCSSSASAPKTVIVNPVPAVPTITAGGATTFCDGDNVVLTSSSATDNVWSTGETTQSITVTTSGSYSVEVTSLGCTSGISAATDVIVNLIPATPTITASSATTFCDGDNVVLTSSSATDNVWSNGATSQSITVTTSGSYDVVVTSNGCSSTVSNAIPVTVHPIPAIPTITASGATTFCDGGSITLTSSSATDNIWSNGATTQSITVTTSGSYSVEVIALGCASGISAATDVIVHPIPATPTITASGATTFCDGENVVLTSSSATDNVWSNGATTQSITVTTSGSYDVVVTSNGCSSTVSNTIPVTVNPVPAVPTITASGATTFCDGGSITLTSSSATDNIWSTGATTQSITVTTSGSYSVEVIALGCASGISAATDVIVHPIPATPTITASGATTFCDGDNVVLTSSSATDNVWSNGATTQSITVTTSGSYDVVVTSNGCSSAVSNAIPVTVDPVPAVPTITASGATTFCDGGSITLTSSSATDNIWSNGETTQSITVTTSGSYSVEVIALGCASGVSAATDVIVNPIPATPTITASGATTFCDGDNVVLTSSSATDNVWSNGATSQSITVTTSGSYDVVVTSNGCSSAVSNAIPVTVNPVPAVPTITASGATTFCDGGSITLISSSATDNIWSTGETTQSIIVTSSGSYSVEVIALGCASGISAATDVIVHPIPATPTITASGATTFCDGDNVVLTSSSATDNVWSNGATTQSITVTTSGSYDVVVTSNGCSSAVSNTIPVTVHPVPSVPTITASGATTFCDGGSITLTSSSATDNIWSTGETTQSIIVTSSGSYSVEAIALGCASGISAATDVTVNPIPATPAITASGATTFCDGGSVTLTSSSATDNVWSNGATTQSITVTTSGSYDVVVTSNGCSSAVSNAIPVTVNPVPAVPTITASGTTTFCDGGSITLTSSSATDNIWSNGATTQSITVTTSGSYSVEVIALGCPSGVSAATNVLVKPTPVTPTITASGATTFCDGGDVVLSSSASTGNLWSNGATTQSIVVTTSGAYSVTVISNGCSSDASNTIPVTVHPVSAVPTITASGTTTFCDGGSVTLTSSSATDNVWSNGATTPSITVTASGSYSVEIIAFGCTSGISATTNVIVHPIPATPTITASGITTFCAGGDVVLSSSSSTGNNWSNGATTQSIIVTASGAYTSTVTSNGCSSAVSNTIPVTVHPIPAIPTITASGSTTICDGDNVLLTSSSATDNIWSTGETSQSISVTTAGSYSVEVNAFGCASGVSAATNVTVNPIPATPTITASGVTTFCDGDNVVLTSSSATDNVWSNGATSQSIIVTTSGSYDVVVTSNGCSSAVSNAIPVTVHPVPAVPTITASGSTTFCDGGSITLTSSSATDNIWSTGATTQSITVTTSGSYSVEVIAFGCASGVSAATNVTVNPIPATPTITASGVTTFCDGDNVVLTSSSATDNVWSNGATSQSIIVTTSGSYDVVVTSNGCSSAVSNAIPVTVHPVPAVPTITASGATTFCDGGSITLTSSSATDNIWSTGETTQSITVTTSGSYSVEVISLGCASGVSLPTNVIVNPIPATPTVTASGATTFCDGDNVVLTSSSATDNVWSNGATTQSITVTTAGNYNVTVSSNGCSSAVSATVTVTTVAPPVITASGATTFCDGGSVILTSSEATGNTWSTGETTSSITVLTSGSYTVTNSFPGCAVSVSAAVPVTVHALPAAPSVTLSGPAEFCDGGSVMLTSSEATGTTWSTGETTASVTVNTSGTYTGVFTDLNGCVSPASAPVIVTVNAIPATPVISANGPTAFCSGGNVELTSSELTGNVWSNGATTQSITVNASGSYSLTYTDSNGCSSAPSLPETITVYPAVPDPVITASGSTTFCDGGSVVLTSSSPTANTWSTGETTASITVAVSGSYSVSFVSADGCPSTVSAVTDVTVNPIPAAPVISAGGTTTFCNGGSVVLTSSETTGNVWSNGATTAAITISASGSYTVSYTDGNGCSSPVSVPVAVTVNPIPAAPVITAGSTTTFCDGNSVVLTSSEANGNLWSDGQSTQSITVSVSGTYSVSFTDLNGCVSPVSTSVPVTVNPVPTVPTITASGATTFCNGGNVTLTSSSATGNLWSNGATTQSITVSASGTFSVEVIALGCTSGASASTTVTVNPVPSVPMITASGATTFCDGNSIVLTSSDATGSTWSNGATTPSITVSVSGNYSVYSTLGSCSSAASAPVSVTVNPIPTVPTITASGSTTFCNGGNVTLTSSSATGNLWSNGATTQSITVSASGTFSVEVIALGCTSGASALTTVTVNPVPAVPSITASGATTFCDGNSIVLTSSDATGNTWSNGATTQSITVSVSGNYSVYSTLGSCSSAASAPVSVTVNPLPAIPTITASGATTFCNGGNVTLTSSSATGNLWSNGATTQSITVSASGTFSVEVIALGCTSGASASTTVTVNPVPAVPSITASGATTFCDGNSIVLTSSDATGNTWSNGATTQSITVSVSGNYSVYSTLGSCSSAASAPVSVTVNPLPAIPTITASGATTFCNGGNVTLTSSSATGNLWSNGATTQSITVSASGTFSVEVIALGCTSGASASTTVTVNPVPAVPSITASGVTTFCAGGNVVLTSSYPSGNLWSNGATTPSITVSASGTVDVIHTNGNGCVSPASATTSVTVNPLPAAPTILNGPTASYCAGGNVVLTSSAGSGNVWSTTATTAAITVTAPGTYTVHILDGNGCASPNASVTVTENSLPAVPAITASGATTFCTGGNVILTADAAASYLWSTGATTQSITVSAAGNYSVSAINASGCSSAFSPATTVTITPTPAAPTISASGPTTFCEGGSVVLTSSAATGNTWSNGATTQSITVSTSGPYDVHIVSGGCPSATSAAVQVLANPVPSTPVIFGNGPTTFCAGQNVILTSSASFGNTWSTTETTPSILVSAAGSYSVTVSNGLCSAVSNTINVLVNPIPMAPVINANGPTTFCAGSSVILSSSVATGNTWSTGQSAQSILVTASGTFTLQYSLNGCPSPNSDPVTVVVNSNPAVPVISASGPLTVCQGESLFLFSSAPAGNTWSNGATSQSIPVTASGSYSLTVTNGQGCSASSASVNAVVNALPVVTFDNELSACIYNGAFSLTGGYPNGGTYSGEGVTNGIFTPSVLGIGSTVLTYTFTDANSCTNSDINSIFVDDCADVEELDLSVLNAYPNPSDGAVTITSSRDLMERIQLYDASGKLVLRSEPSALMAELDLSLLSNGVYTAEISSGKALKYLRLVVNH